MRRVNRPAAALVTLHGVSSSPSLYRTYVTSRDSHRGHYNSKSAGSSSSNYNYNNDNRRGSKHAEVEDWSTIEVEVLEPAAAASVLSSSSPASSFSTAAHASAATPGESRGASASEVQHIDAVDTYAKAKVMNFLRRQQPQQGQTFAASGTAIPGMEVRAVQGAEAESTQFHARWQLPLPAEYGTRFAEGFAPTAKEAEGVAAMHAERIIDALGFPLFLLSSKQRKHAEAARAAGRWAPFPPPTAGDGSGDGGAAAATAELTPPPETPSPPPLQLVHVSARQQQERQLHIDNVAFSPVERGVFNPFACTLASPYYYDFASVKRMESFFRSQRTSFARCLRFFKLQGEDGKSTRGRGAGHSASPQKGQSYVLAQLTLPLPPQFGIRIAMGRGPTKKDAAGLACMHAELIIDAVGFALFPEDAKKQATHATECARVRRWCAAPGSTAYRFNTASPPPLELVERFGPAEAAAAAASRRLGRASGPPPPQADGGEVDDQAAQASGRGRRDGSGADGSVAGGVKEAGDAEFVVGWSSSGSAESILVQHNRAVVAASHFANEVSMRDYVNAHLMLDRYLAQFVATAPSTSDGGVPALNSLMFADTLGQRDRQTHRTTITIPLVNKEEEQASASDPTGDSASPSTPLSYTESFVAIGIADTPEVSQLAASLHALRTLATLNRLTLQRGSPAMNQALESFAVRGHLPFYCPSKPMRAPAEVPPEELPAPVRVMEGVYGRIATQGVAQSTKAVRAQVFTPGVTSPTARDTRFAAKRENCFPGELLHQRQDYLLRELQEARGRLPRPEWDTTADAHGRIIVAPGVDSGTQRRYTHTLSSVRQPDPDVSLRVRDYFERHGKLWDTVSTTTRVEQSPEEEKREGALLVTTLVLPVPDATWRRIVCGAAASAGDDAADTVASSPASSSASPLTGTAVFTATGEAATREESVLMCHAHAELLLDALGVPMYDHPVLQHRHADTARTLGRWAPLARSGMPPPAALCPLPPPLRKVTPQSALWAEVQRSRASAAAEAAAIARESEGSATAPGASSTTLATPASSPATEEDIAARDNALCDLSKMQFVHVNDLNMNSLNSVRLFFASKQLDYFRVLQQYRVKDEQYGKVYRCIVELPLPPNREKLFAVGVADRKRHAFCLCTLHAQDILRSLGQLHGRPKHLAATPSPRSGRKGRAGKSARREAHDKVGESTSLPLGYYSLQLSDAASERPFRVPPRPTARDAWEFRVWLPYLHACDTYIKQVETHIMTKALMTQPVPTLPPSHVPVEDAAMEAVRLQPADKAVLRELREHCEAAGLPSAVKDRVPVDSMKLLGGKRAYWTTIPLLGTPYTLRGCSLESATESRFRACLPCLHLLQTVVRWNSIVAPTRRKAWGEGLDRRGGVLDALDGRSITHHGRLWVLRVWSATHSPARSLQLKVREGEAEEAKARPESEAPSPLKESPSDAAAPPAPPPSIVQLYHVVVSVVERRGCEAPLEIIREAHTSPAQTASAAVEMAVQRLFASLQRTPTMQALHCVLSGQPQLHLPSLRVLRDAGGEGSRVVQQLARQILPPTATQQTAESDEAAVGRVEPCKILQRDGVPSAHLSAASSASQQKAQAYTTWPVHVLLEWLDAHAAGTPRRAEVKNLPTTLVPFFTSYGLATQRATAACGESSGATYTPSPLAAALALLCSCLPPHPTANASAPAAPQRTSNSTLPDTAYVMVVQRDRTLPLQLAHVLLMGLLLDCVYYAVRMVAMIVHAVDTMEWCGRAAGRSSAAWPVTSVDVVEAVLLSLDGASPPLPPLVDAYAADVLQRLHRLSTAAAHGASTTEATWLAAAARGASSMSVSPPASLSVAKTRLLRSLLQCAVAAATAGEGVWVRAAAVEDVVREHHRRQAAMAAEERDEEEEVSEANADASALPSKEEIFVFQSRRVAGMAALRVNGADLTRTDCDSHHTLSSMATNFTAFACSVEAVAVAVGGGEESNGHRRRKRHWWTAQPIACARPRTTGESGGDADEEQEQQEEERDEEHEEEEEETEDAPPLSSSLFTRVLGTSVSPLAAMVVHQHPYTSHATPLRVIRDGGHAAGADNEVDVSGLRLVEEDVPMLMTAYGDTVPLLVHNNATAVALQRLAAHLRLRVRQLAPFSPAERDALGQLLNLAVEAVRDDGIDDLPDEAQAE